MIKFFTKQEFNDRAERFYRIFCEQFVSKNFKNVHITNNINKGTTMIYNNATGKVGFAKCHPSDEFSLVIGIGIAWQRYCNDYFEPIFIKQLDDVKSLKVRDYFVCKPYDSKTKTRELYKIIDVIKTKSTITNETITMFKSTSIKTGHISMIREFESIYMVDDANWKEFCFDDKDIRNDNN